MQAGEATYLHQEPRLRGNVARVTKEGFYVTWHRYIDDVPECLAKDSHVDVRAASVRMRVFYRHGEAKNVGFGVPR